MAPARMNQTSHLRLQYRPTCCSVSLLLRVTQRSLPRRQRPAMPRVRRQRAPARMTRMHELLLCSTGAACRRVILEQRWFFTAFRLAGRSTTLRRSPPAQGRARQWMRGFAEYSAIFSHSEASSFVQSQLADHRTLELRPDVLIFKADRWRFGAYVSEKIWVVFQAAADWRPCNVQELLGIVCTVLCLHRRIWRQEPKLKGLHSVKGPRSIIISLRKNSVTETTGWGLLWPSQVWRCSRCSARKCFYGFVGTPGFPSRSVWIVMKILENMLIELWLWFVGALSGIQSGG